MDRWMWYALGGLAAAGVGYWLYNKNVTDSARREALALAAAAAAAAQSAMPQFPVTGGGSTPDGLIAMGNAPLIAAGLMPAPQQSMVSRGGAISMTIPMPA